MPPVPKKLSPESQMINNFLNTKSEPPLTSDQLTANPVKIARLLQLINSKPEITLAEISKELKSQE